MKNYTFLPELSPTTMVQYDTAVSQVHMVTSFPKTFSFATFASSNLRTAGRAVKPYL